VNLQVKAMECLVITTSIFGIIATIAYLLATAGGLHEGWRFGNAIVLLFAESRHVHVAAKDLV